MNDPARLLFTPVPRRPALRVLTRDGRDPLVERTISAVCLAYGLRPEVLRGSRRRRAEADARRYAAHLMRERGLTLQEIGRALGRPGGGAVISMLRTMQWRLAFEPGAALRLDLIRSLVRGARMAT